MAVQLVSGQKSVRALLNDTVEGAVLGEMARPGKLEI